VCFCKSSLSVLALKNGRRLLMGGVVDIRSAGRGEGDGVEAGGWVKEVKGCKVGGRGWRWNGMRMMLKELLKGEI